jgi:hypothetical protein
MAGLLAVVLAATVGLVGVVVGARLTGRREHERWKRDQQLRAAVDFIGATGRIYDRNQGRTPPEVAAGDPYSRLQDSRSAIHLLCDKGTVDLAEALVRQVRKKPDVPMSSGVDDDTLQALQRFVQAIRRELGMESAKGVGTSASVMLGLRRRPGPTPG